MAVEKGRFAFHAKISELSSSRRHSKNQKWGVATFQHCGRHFDRREWIFFFKINIITINLTLQNVAVVIVAAGSPSRGGDVAVHVSDINQPSLPTPFCSVLVSISIYMDNLFNV